MADSLSNSVYAPGLTTYTPTADQGAPGKRGISLHYANIDLSNSQNLSYVSELISSGLPLNDVAKVSETTETYAVDDYVIDSIGSIYRIVESGDTLAITSDSKEGKLSDTRKHYSINSSDIITIDDGFILFALDSTLAPLEGALTSGETVPSNTVYLQQIDESTGTVTTYTI